ncbi:hypothetical protein GCM10010521_23550 [Streptomyces rameus]|uniref:Uncharacterized protein n=1 Tax=Streptomyces rameus TaxID=68261 RepID=A0ABP6N5B4_9ACTN
MNDCGPGTGSGTAAEPVEQRLRAALAARAHAVGPADLRPPRPPAGPVRSRRVVARRTVAGLLALAAVAALVFFTMRGGASRPAEPARPAHPRTGTPSPAPSTVTPSTAQPSPSAPRP